MSALGHEGAVRLLHTKLSSPLAINRDVCPVIRPVNLSRLSQRKYGLNCESHSGFAHSYNLTLAVVRYPRRGMEMGVDTMATPGRDDTAVSGLGMLLNDAAKLSY